jgi:hypothetical protein
MFGSKLIMSDCEVGSSYHSGHIGNSKAVCDRILVCETRVFKKDGDCCNLVIPCCAVRLLRQALLLRACKDFASSLHVTSPERKIGK